MDKKLYNTWMTVTSLVMAVIGLAFILVSIFDAGAGTSVLAVGLVFITLANLLNFIRIRQGKKEE